MGILKPSVFRGRAIMFKHAFTKHPASVGESYFQHLGMAFGFGTKMIAAGFACLLHGLFPFLFTCTGSKCIEDLHAKMVTHRDRRLSAEATSGMPALASDANQLPAAE